MENNFIDMNEKDERIEHANFASAYTTPGPEERNLSEMKKVYTFSFFFSIQNIQNDSILFLQQLYFTSLNVLFIIQKKNLSRSLNIFPDENYLNMILILKYSPGNKPRFHCFRPI